MIGLTSINSDAQTKAAKKKVKKPRLKNHASCSDIWNCRMIFPLITAALNSVQELSDVMPKPDSKPFDWQDRSSP